MEFEDRKRLSKKIKNMYPEHYPIIIKSKNIKLEKTKYILHGQSSLYKLRKEIIDRNSLNYNEGIYFETKGMIINVHEKVINVHDKYASEDGFIYFVLLKESTFG